MGDIWHMRVNKCSAVYAYISTNINYLLPATGAISLSDVESSLHCTNT